jgi:biotin carboxyl carrier protein
VEYKLKYNEESVALAVAADGEKQFKATIGERQFDVAFKRISDSRLNLVVNGRQTTAFVADTPGGKAVTVNGRTWLFEDERTRGARPRGGPQKGPQAVTPPMPAVVTKILVAAGETVEKGQGLLVVSAMKMDTTLTAPFDGVVTRINCAEGDKVTPRQVLVDIEAAKEEAAMQA